MLDVVLERKNKLLYCNIERGDLDMLNHDIHNYLALSTFGWIKMII